MVKWCTIEVRPWFKRLWAQYDCTKYFVSVTSEFLKIIGTNHSIESLLFTGKSKKVDKRLPYFTSHRNDNLPVFSFKFTDYILLVNGKTPINGLTIDSSSEKNEFFCFVIKWSEELVILVTKKNLRRRWERKYLKSPPRAKWT